MKSLRSRFSPAAIFLTRLLPLFLLGASCALAWVRDGAPVWTDGTVTLRLMLGDSPSYSDGTTPNGTALAALAEWNPYMGRVQLAGSSSGSGQGTKGNAVNDVFFSSTVYGQAFDSGVLAITLTRYSSTTRTESDVVVNQDESWDAYRGTLHVATDLRRVLAHEFGHVLGLDHPDEHGQVVTALMNSTVTSYVETPQPDDQDGVASMYGYGTANKPAPPNLYWDLSDVTVYVGDPISLQPGVNGVALTYQWQKDGVDIKGATLSNYRIAAAQLTDAGLYDVVITNGGGTVTTRQAKVTVNTVPAPILSNQPGDVTCYATQSAYFYAYSSSPHVKYQWRKDGADIAGATSSSFSISNAALTDAGLYSVSLSNEGGTVASRDARLTVNAVPLPKITTNPTDVAVRLYESLALSVQYDCPVNASVQWYKDGKAISGGTSSWYSLNYASASDAGRYYATITDPAGTVTSTEAVVTILPAALPKLLQGRNQTITSGGQVTLGWYDWSTSPNPTTYQWYHNGVAIQGATSSSYVIGNASLADAGEYYAVCTNSVGSVASPTMTLTVQLQASTSVQWSATGQQGSVAYFLYQSPARIERFDLGTGSWLTPIPLTGLPTAMLADSHGLFVAFSSRIDRFEPDGTGQTTWVASAGGTVQGMAALGNSLVAYYSGSYSSNVLAQFDFKDAHLIATNDGMYFYSQVLASVPSLNRLYTLSTGVSATWVVQVPLNASGAISGYSLFNYLYVYPNESRLFVTPDGAYVIGGSGTVYDSSLKFAGAVAPALDTTQFADGSLAVVNRDSIVIYDKLLHEQARLPNNANLSRVVAYGDKLYGFAPPAASGTSPVAVRIDGPYAENRASAAPVDPSSITFPVDKVFVDRDGIVNLYSKVFANIFRWSPDKRAYLPSIGLQGAPNFVTYSSQSHRIYLGYADGRLTQIRLDQGESAEVPFAMASAPLGSLVAAGNYVFCSESGLNGTAGSLFGPDGTRKDQAYTGDAAADYQWDPVLGRLYSLSDQSSSATLRYVEVLPTGKFGLQRYTAYNSTNGISGYPIRVTPDGGQVLLGSGHFISSVSLLESDHLPSRSDDAAWLGATSYSFLNTLDGVALDRWAGAGYASDTHAVVAGRGLRLFVLTNNRFLLVAMRNNVLHFVILDKDLNVLSDDGPKPTERMLGLSTRSQVGSGDNVLVSGFVIDGKTPKQVVVRAVGPGLSQFNINGYISDPQVVIYNDKKVAIAANDNYGSAANLTDLKAAMKRLGNFDLPAGSRDAAMLITLNPGLYTAQVSGVGGATGVGILEVYDADEAPGTCRMMSLSSRAQVGAGDSILVSGVVVGGTSGKTVIIRGIGPTLAKFNLTGYLRKPRVRLYKDSTLIAENSDWSADGTKVDALTAAFSKTGLFALDVGSGDAALMVHLDPGLYTAQVDGADGSTGVALLEVYEVPQ